MNQTALSVAKGKSERNMADLMESRNALLCTAN